MSRSARGFTLIEVLIALVLLAFGLLALARVMARAGEAEVEALQRSQAMTLAQDMVDRINLNRAQAVQYVGDYVPEGAPADCGGGDPAPPLAERDRCEWTRLLAGAPVTDGDRPVGAPLAARGCIAASAPNVYVVVVAWQGIAPTQAPDNPCGAGGFDREENRRVFSTVVQIATLGT